MSSKLNLIALTVALVVMMSESNFALPVAQGPFEINEPLLSKGYEEPPHIEYHEPKGYFEKLGRVKIQAYRGASKLKKDGYHKEYFAPFGHYQTQPADAKKKKY